jgi:predicted dehydrogenase
MKILIIGFGSIAKRHINNLIHNINCEIIVYSRRKNIRFLDHKKITVLNSLEKCLLEKPDVALITNETAFHIPMAIKMAKSGLDLFIEKPLSNSTNGIKTLQKIVKQKKLVTQMGCNLRFHKCIIKIRQLINQKKIGKVISIQSENGSYLPDWHPNEDYRKGYASDRQLGGGIILTMIHDIDYLYWIFGNPKSIFSVSGKFSDLDISAEDYCSSIIEFKNNITAELHLDFFQRPEFRGCKIKGTKGVIYWNSDKNEIRLFKNRKKVWEVVLALKKFQRNEMYIDEIIHFLKCVKNRKQTINNLDEGIKTMNIALAMKKSSKNRRMIKI